MAKRLGAKRNTPTSPPAPEGHNSGMAPEERAKAEAENKRLRYISGVAAIRSVDPKIGVARAALKELTDQRKDIITDLTKDGHLKKEIEADLIDVGAVRRNVDAAELARAQRRAWLGLPVGRSDEQLELESRLPDVEKGAIEHRASGYTAGISGQDGQPPAEVAKAGFIAEWSQGWKDGQAILIMAMGKKSPKPKAEPKPEPTPEEERKAEREATARAKASLEAMKPLDDHTQGETAAGVIHEPGTNGIEGDEGFEASTDELDAQKVRPSVQDAEAEAQAEAEGVE